MSDIPTQNIAIEANEQFYQLYNIDNLREIYRLPIVNLYDGYIKLEKLIFFDINIPILERYRFFLLNGSKYKFLETKYHFRPDYLSFDEYGTTALRHLLMYINNISSVMEFNPTKLYVPTIDTIEEFIMDYENTYGIAKTIKDIRYL